MKALFTVCISLLLLASCGSQSSNDPVAPSETNGDFISQRHLHEKKYDGVHLNSEEEWDRLNGRSFERKFSHRKKLRSDIHTFGWHIYSNGSSWKHYDFSILWGISYFSYSIEPKTGNYKSIHQWKTTEMIDTAKAYNCKVFLSISNFGSENNALFLNNTKAQTTLMDSLVELLAYRSADGINIDFEGVPKASKNKFSSFIAAISKRLKRENPDYQISLCLYADDWNDIFDIKVIDTHVDFYTLMGYDYYGAFSKTTGPVTPFNTSEKFGKGLKASVQSYQDKGVQFDKLIVGLPYYGAEWMTMSKQPGSNVVKFRSHPPYKSIREVYIDSLHIPVQFDSASASTYLVVKEGKESYRQLFFEDRKSLGMKYDWIQQQKIKGVGFWALGYDYGYPDLWNLLGEKFAE